MKEFVSQKHYRNTRVLNLLNKFFVVLLLLTATCCQSNKTEKSNSQFLSQIEELQETISTDFDQLDRINQEDIVNLKANIAFFDSVLITKGEETSSPARISLSTANEYTKQFDSEFSGIIEDIKFTKQQLSDLQDDIKANIYDNHTIITYLISERDAVNHIHAKTNYFTDRLNAQTLLIKTLEEKHQIVRLR